MQDIEAKEIIETSTENVSTALNVLDKVGIVGRVGTCCAEVEIRHH